MAKDAERHRESKRTRARASVHEKERERERGVIPGEQMAILHPCMTRGTLQQPLDNQLANKSALPPPCLTFVGDLL